MMNDRLDKETKLFYIQIPQKYKDYYIEYLDMSVLLKNKFRQHSIYRLGQLDGMILSQLHAWGGFGSPLLSKFLKILKSIKNDELVTIYGPEYENLMTGNLSRDILLFPIDRLNLPLAIQDELRKAFDVSLVGEYIDILYRGLLSTQKITKEAADIIWQNILKLIKIGPDKYLENVCLDSEPSNDITDLHRDNLIPLIISSSLSEKEISFDTLKLFPFFSGKKIEYYGPFYESNKLKTLLSDLKLPDDFKNILSIMGLITLEELLLTDCVEFLYYPRIENNTLLQIRQIITEYLHSSVFEEVLLKDNRTDIDRVPEYLKQCRFFSRNNNFTIRSNDLKKIYLSDLGFNVRFHNSIRKLNSITNLEELLNTNPIDLLILRGFGQYTLTAAQNVIVDFLNFRQIVDVEVEEIKVPTKSYIKFLKPNKYYYEDYDTNILNTGIYNIKYPIKFKSVLFVKNKISTLKDLLDLNPNDFLDCCDRNTIVETQDAIINYLSDPNTYKNENTSSRIDENIIEGFKAIFKKERDLEIFLIRNKYYDQQTPTLEYIANKFNLTRERVRQIIKKCEKKIIRNKFIFYWLAEFVKDHYYVVSVGTLYQTLVKEKLWSETKFHFYETIVKELLGQRYQIYYEDGFIVSSEFVKKTDIINQLYDIVARIVNDSKDGIPIDYLQEQVSKHLVLNDIDTAKLLNFDLIYYLSNKLSTFYVLDDRVLSPQSYCLFEGRLLKDVVIASLLYLNEPIHFSLLGEFIRAHNKYFSDVTNATVHSTLVNSNLCHDINRGVYALKEWNLPKHVTAGEALIKLLQEKGPMLEDDIMDNLLQKYRLWNVKMALENNKNKLIKIGNNLLDLKEEIYESN